MEKSFRFHGRRRKRSPTAIFAMMQQPFGQVLVYLAGVRIPALVYLAGVRIHSPIPCTTDRSTIQRHTVLSCSSLPVTNTIVELIRSY